MINPLVLFQEILKGRNKTKYNEKKKIQKITIVCPFEIIQTNSPHITTRNTIEALIFCWQ